LLRVEDICIDASAKRVVDTAFDLTIYTWRRRNTELYRTFHVFVILALICLSYPLESERFARMMFIQRGEEQCGSKTVKRKREEKKIKIKRK
jgi:hypothetical protein